MTFQRSLYISFGIHILLFGSALAFAQYGHVLGYSDTITVMLVGSGSSSEKSLQKSIVPPGLESDRSRETPHPHAASRMDDTREGQTDVKTPKAATPDSRAGTTTADGVAEQLSDSKKSFGETGSQFGIITPDQWQIIQAALERAKTYPRMARERGIEGVVQVRFKILPSGTVERVEILKSSGSEILDAASVKTVYRSGPLPRVSGWVEVPISYSIIK